MTEIRKADAKALLLVLALGSVGGLLIAGLESGLATLREALLSESGELRQRLRIGLILVEAVLFLPLGGFAIYLWKLGAKVSKAGEYPPPDFLVVRDTPVVRGKAAMWRARALMAAAWGMLAAIGLFSWLFWRVFNAFGM
jgi:hypothetical protein